MTPIPRSVQNLSDIHIELIVERVLMRHNVDKDAGSVNAAEEIAISPGKASETL